MRTITLIYIFLLITTSAQAQEITFTFPDIAFEQGEKVEMPCRVYGFNNMAAFQWGVLFDTAFLKLDSVKATNQLPEYGPDNFSYYEISQSQFIKPGSLYTLWTGVPCRTLEEGVTIFRAWFTAKKSGSLAQSIVNYPQGMEFEAVNCQFEYYDVNVVFVSETTGINAPQGEPLHISPNPFNEYFTLNISGLLTLYDLSGRMVYRGSYQSGDPAGIDLARGVYFGIIENSTFKIEKW